MDSNQFSTTDTNYQGVDFDTSTSVGKGIDTLIASNNQQYKQMAQDAIAAAETKSPRRDGDAPSSSHPEPE